MGHEVEAEANEGIVIRPLNEVQILLVSTAGVRYKSSNSSHLWKPKSTCLLKNKADYRNLSCYWHSSRSANSNGRLRSSEERSRYLFRAFARTAAVPAAEISI